MSEPAIRVYSPGGNVTALVSNCGDAYVSHCGDVYVSHCGDAAVSRREIQDHIMNKYKDVEQVGFIDSSDGIYSLTMTGGEFCGNAARAAAWHFLYGRPGVLKMKVSGVKKMVEAGVTESLDAWVSIPLENAVLTYLRSGRAEAEQMPPVETRGAETGGRGKPANDICAEAEIALVKMEGVSHLVFSENASHKYLKGYRAAGRDSGYLLNAARGLADTLFHNADSLYDGAVHGDGSAAFGVIFMENVDGFMKIHPCVFVRAAGTAFYETACGSGCAAAVMALCRKRRCGVSAQILQPSGAFIETSVRYVDGRFIDARISGKVKTLL